MYDVAIIGCGVVGGAIACELSLLDVKTLVLEKENDIAQGTSKANSAIVHAGFDPHPGTLMAKYNVIGSNMMEDLCHRLSVPYKRIGSLVLAYDGNDAAQIKKELERGTANGVKGLRILGRDEVRRMEPNVSDEVIAALYAPTAAIVSPWELAIALCETAHANGADFYFNSEVESIAKEDGIFKITAGGQTYEAKYVVNAAGIHSAEIHNLVAKPAFEIEWVKGEYYILDQSQAGLVNTVVFQCPKGEFKGVLVSPTVHGNVIVGPNAAAEQDGEDVSNSRTGLAEVAESAAKAIPSVNLRFSIKNFSGMRAEPSAGDFIIREAEDAPNFVDVAGIRSPGLSSSPAIAVAVRELLVSMGLSDAKKSNPVTERKKAVFKNLTDAEKEALIKKDSRYGRIVCRCETVTEGEIVDALQSPLTPPTLDAVKRRCMPGMGRCQGGFCGPRVLEIIARERGLDPTQVLQNKEGSIILTGRTKDL